MNSPQTQGNEKYEPSLPERVGFSSALVVSVDLWSQVVAHRVGIRSSAVWRGDVGVNEFSVNVACSRGNRVTKVTPYYMANHWRRLALESSEIPRETNLSPWAKRIVYNCPKDATDPLATMEHCIGHPGDLSSVRAAYLTISHVLWSTRNISSIRNGRWTEGLAAWLFATPHLFQDSKLDLDERLRDWCFLKHGEKCSDDDIRKAENGVRAFAREANRLIGIQLLEMTPGLGEHLDRTVDVRRAS